MFSIVLMAALTSGQAAPDFLFHHHHHCCGGYHGCCSTACYGGYCCYSSPGYWGGCSCSSYGVGCYSGCCYAGCGCYSGCAAFGGMHGGDAVNANGGWGMPYSSYAPMGGDPHGAPWLPYGVAPGSVYPGGVANPSMDGPPVTDPMKKADDKPKDKDGKDKDGKDKDGKDKDGKDKDGKDKDGKDKVLNNPSPNRARLIVSVPSDAKLYIDDQPMKTGSERRSFSTPVLVEGETYFYEIRVEIMRDGKPINDSRKVNVRAGEVARVDFRDLDSIATVKAK